MKFDEEKLVGLKFIEKDSLRKFLDDFESCFSGDDPDKILKAKSSKISSSKFFGSADDLLFLPLLIGNDFEKFKNQIIQ